MNQWIGQQHTWGERQLKEREQMLEEQFLETWPFPQSTYEPSKVLPEVADLDSDVEFTGRRIAAFSFIGVRYVATQWNNMEEKVLQLVYELEPAKIHSLVDATAYPGSNFSKTDKHGYSRIAERVYVHTASSTAAKIDLLKAVFDYCDINASELSFEMPLDADSGKES